MKTRFFILCLICTVLLISLAVPVCAVPSISSISPAYAYNSAQIKNVVISGSNLNVTGTNAKVWLEMDGESNILASSKSYDADAGTVTCTFPIAGKEPGDWDVVVRDKDSDEDVLSGGFTIYAAITLTSVSPTSAQTNDDDVTVTVSGTGLSDIDYLYLYNSDYDNITADITSRTSTKVVGKFNLEDADIDSFDICVMDSLETIKCGLDFEIVTDEVGSIDVETSPSGAKVYLDSSYVGTTPITLDDISPGSHKILLQKTGYVDYTKWVTVKADSTESVSADLNAVATAATTKPPTVVTTKTPLKATTVKVPTSWPTPATTQASLPGALVVLGTIALGFVLYHRK